MTNKTMEAATLGNRLRIAGWGTAALLLLLPLAAMQFTDEVNWTGSDFLFAAGLIGGTGLLLELTVRTNPNLFYRGGVALALAGAFLLIWINGAVGIIGDEGNPLNLLYLGVIAISLAGSTAARFGASGMAWAMFAATAAMIAMLAVAVVAGSGEPPGPIGLIIINGFFAGLYFASGWLFRAAAAQAPA